MTSVEIDLPVEWTEKSSETRWRSTVVEYVYKTDDETTFIVSVLPQTEDEGGYKLHLSTIDPTSTQIRHDYLVYEYDSLKDAVAGTESFIEQLSLRLREESISSADPEIEAIRETIQAFRGNRLVPSLRHLLRRFR